MAYPNIAAERARYGMSVDEFAAKLGVTRKTVYNWEAAGKIPDNALLAMSQMFGVSIEYLLNHEPVTPKE